MTEKPILAERLGAGISYTVLTAIGLTSNILVLLALHKHRKIFSKYPFYTLVKHLIIGSIGELIGEVLVAIPLSFAGRALYGNDTVLIILSSFDTFFFFTILFFSLFIALNRFFAVFLPKLYTLFFTDFRLHITCASAWMISALWVIVTTVIGCPKIFRHDGFYYTYRCINDTTDFADTLMNTTERMSYVIPVLMLLIYALVLWKVRRLISYRSSDGHILIQSVLICFAFEVETVLFALLPDLEPTFGLFWLSLILDCMLILTASMSSLILLFLNPLIRTTVRDFFSCRSSPEPINSYVHTNYRIYDISDDYGRNFQNGGYNINWNLDPSSNVNFNLTYNNFPQDGNYWIGFGYWENKVILVNTLNSQVQIETADINNNQPTKTVGSNVLQSQSGSLSNGNLQAQFSIPLQALNAASEGQSCMNWQFYISPTQNGTSYSGSPQSQQVCNLQQTCNEDGGQYNQVSGSTVSPYGQSFSSSPSPYSNQGYQPQYNPSSQFNQGYQYNQNPQFNQNSQFNQGYQYNQNSQFNQNPQFNQNSQFNQGYQYNQNPQFNQNQQYGNPGYSNQFNPNSGYSGSQNPQNSQQYDPNNPNVQYYPYTYNQGFSGDYSGNQINPQFDSPPQTNSNSDFVIENPNYQFLNPQLNQVFRDNEFKGQNGNGNGALFDQNGLTVTTTTEAPVLSNEQQNQANYQRILQNPPTTANPGLYTNNIYGYDYRSNQNMPYTINGNPQQYLPPNVRKFQPAPGSPFRRRKRQANSPSANAFNDGSLQGTAYQGQDTQFIRNDNYATFFDTAINPFDANNPIYYPYLTPVANPNSPDFNRVLQQDAAAQQAYQDPSCVGTDPYWCQNYVQNYMLWQNQYDNNNAQPNQAPAAMQPSQSACSALIDSLKNAYHRCCQTVRTVGCQ